MYAGYPSCNYGYQAIIPSLFFIQKRKLKKIVASRLHESVPEATERVPGGGTAAC
jgi:hypothetical protein